MSELHRADAAWLFQLSAILVQSGVAKNAQYYAGDAAPGQVGSTILSRMPTRAVLLVNLGSPDSPSVADVRRYLREFLGDRRVIDIPGPLRWLLLEGVILRTRPKKSAHAYASIWTSEGSPLMRISRNVRGKLADIVDAEVQVYLAMRYGSPS